MWWSHIANLKRLSESLFGLLYPFYFLWDPFSALNAKQLNHSWSENCIFIPSPAENWYDTETSPSWYHVLHDNEDFDSEVGGDGDGDGDGDGCHVMRGSIVWQWGMRQTGKVCRWQWSHQIPRRLFCNCAVYCRAALFTDPFSELNCFPKCIWQWPDQDWTQLKCIFPPNSKNLLVKPNCRLHSTHWSQCVRRSPSLPACRQNLLGEHSLHGQGGRLSSSVWQWDAPEIVQPSCHPRGHLHIQGSGHSIQPYEGHTDSHQPQQWSAFK